MSGVRILVVEDDVLQAESIMHALKHSFGDVHVNLVCTVSEFRDQFLVLRDEPPDLVVVDLMLALASLDDLSLESLASNADDDRLHEGGLACLKMLLDDAKTQHIPVIIYTVLDRQDVPETPHLPRHVLFLRKGADDRPLIRAIRSLLPGLPGPGSERFLSRLGRSIEAKPGWMGFSVDLKRLMTRRKRDSSNSDSA